MFRAVAEWGFTTPANGVWIGKFYQPKIFLASPSTNYNSEPWGQFNS